MNNNITIAEIIAIKGGTVSELCQYASSKGIKLPNDPTYVLSSSELNAIDPLLAYKLKWGVSTAKKNTNKTDGNKPREFLEAALQNKRKLTKAEKKKKTVQQRSSSESYDIRIGLKKPKRPRMTRTPNPQIELKRANVTAFTEIKTTADVDAAVECFVWPSPEYNRKNDFFVQKLIGQNEDLLNYYHKKMKAYFGIEHVLKKDYDLKQHEREDYWDDESDYHYEEENVEEETTNDIESDEETENNIDSIDFDALAKGLNELMKRMADESIHELDKRKQSSPVSNKISTRVVKLPQPIAQLACSGLLESIETSYLGTWRPGEVLLIYAEDETPEFMKQLELQDEIYAVYYNALVFGNLQYPIFSSAYIGLIELGKKSFKYYHKRYVNIIGAELLNEPLDNMPEGMELNKTHTVKFRNIVLENDVVKVPLSEMSWEWIEKDHYLRLYWENRFKGFNYGQNEYSYLFYSDKGEKLFVPVKNESSEDEEDELDENVVRPVYQGKDNEGKRFLCFDLEKLEEKPVKKSSFDVLQKKEWILDWKCVNFKHGMIVIYAPTDGSMKFKPKAVSVPGSLESFNYLKDYLNDRLSPVRCYVENLNLTIYDSIRLNEAIEKFAVASRQRGIKVGKNNTQPKIAPQQTSFNQALSKAQQMTPEDFKKYKSEYIDYLVSQQSKKYKVIPCVERLAYSYSDMTEYAFIFSIQCKSGDILIVHENVNPDRSTLLFIVKPENYDKAIRAVYDFLQSAEINKRSSLRDRDVELGESGIVRYRSINHDYIFSWKRVISSYKLHYKNGIVYYY